MADGCGTAVDGLEVSLKRSQIPSLVKRNTLFLSGSQAIFMCIGQAAFILAALAVLQMTGSPTLAGLATSVIWGARVVIVYETGILMDRLGRRVVLLLGVVASSLSALVMGWAVITGVLEMFWMGLVLYGFGSGILQQSRIAVADMYPVDRRGEGIGYLMTGNVVGSLLSPLFTAAMIPIANYFQSDVYGVILLASTAVLALSSVLIAAIRPDPREIARNLHTYYLMSRDDEQLTNFTPKNMPIIRWLMVFPILAAFIASASATGDMTMMMALVSVVMHQHEIALTLISLAVTLHVVGMFALSIPIGRLSDRIGRKWVASLGGLVLAVGAVLTPITNDYATIALGIFLVGLGWSAASVATTAIISDLTHPERRGRVLGANDVAIGLASLALPVLGGAAISQSGVFVLGLVGFVVALPALVMPLPVRETSPGRYSVNFPVSET